MQSDMHECETFSIRCVGSTSHKGLLFMTLTKNLRKYAKWRDSLPLIIVKNLAIALLEESEYMTMAMLTTATFDLQHSDSYIFMRFKYTF